MNGFSQDIRGALRALRRTPAFTAVAVVLIAVGIGMSTAAFSLVDAVYFRSLPYADPNRVVLIEATNVAGPDCQRRCSRTTTPAELRAWLPRLPGVQALAGLRVFNGTMVTPAATELMDGAVVSANFFDMLGLRPLVGRTFVPEDDRLDAVPVAILSQALWQDRFGSDRNIIGRSIELNGRSYRVVGIMPLAGAVGAPIFRATAVTAPFYVSIGPFGAENPARARFETVLARLEPRALPAKIRAQLDVLMQQPGDPAAGQPATSPPVWRASITSIRELHVRQFAFSYRLVLGAVVFVTLVACTNVAGLFWARLGDRRPEIVVRSAIGASRGRLARPLLVEAGLLATAGGILGTLIASWSASLSQALIPAWNVPYWTAFVIDWRVALFSASLTVLSAILFGVGPVLLLTRLPPTLAMRESKSSLALGGRAAATTRRMLIGVQISLTLILLTAASLLGKTLLDATRRDLGMARQHLVLGLLYGRGTGYDSAERQRALAEAVLERLRGLPDADGASLSGSPLAPAADGLSREGDREMLPREVAPASAASVSPDEFRVQGIPLVHGRLFSTTDGPNAPPVAILDEPTARHLFRDRSAVGQRVKFGQPSSPNPWMTVVGVVGAVRGSPLRSNERYSPTMYRPLSQAPTPMLEVAVRTRAAPDLAITAVRAALHEVAPSVPLATLTTIEARLSQQMAPLRMNAAIFGTLAIFAMVIAALGVYTMISNSVAQQTRDIGIRAALGAPRASVLWLTLRSAVANVAIGLGGGLIGSMFLTRLLRAWLYDTSPTDAVVFLEACALLAVVGVVAALVPARRAMLVDPMTALRHL